jgi:replicative DNA helicase
MTTTNIVNAVDFAFDPNSRRARTPNRTDRASNTGAAIRLLPHNLEAEESLLGAMLLSETARIDAFEICNANDFYAPKHGHIYSAIHALFTRGEPADPVTVAEQLQRNGLLDLIGGSPTLVSLQAGTPTITNAAYYAKIVVEHSRLRNVIAATGEATELAYAVPEDIDATLDHIESVVFGATQRQSSTVTAPIAVHLAKFLDDIEALQEAGNSITGVPTGFTDLDAELLGLHGGELIVIGARPAMGKSALALGISAHVALRVKRPALHVTLEMSADELTKRLVAQEAHVDLKRLRSGNLGPTDWTSIEKTMATIGTAPLEFNDAGRLTITDIRATARRVKQRHGDLGVIVVDYLQLMTGRNSVENRQLEVAEIVRGLKTLARELDVPVIALSQLSRTLESRADKRPLLSDLRESGEIEQSADVVAFLYRDEVYNTDSPDKGIAELNIAKHRAGALANLKLVFLGHQTRFANMAK